MKRVAIVQSNYIPWKGYFDLINSVDEFILLDEVQYTRQDWRNRNRIKTAQGTSWLTIPVRVDGLYEQRLDETEVADPDWATRHWDVLRQAYRAAPHFEALAAEVESAYERCRSEPLLSRINRTLIEAVCAMLGIRTTLAWSTDYSATGARSERVVDLCKHAHASVYLSGPRARAYLDEQLFEQAGIELVYVDYAGYSEYEQLHRPFEHEVTVLDLLFNTGERAPSLMKSFGAVETRA
jgi:WbqC-like protein family